MLVRGDSGCGKSTLLSLAAGVLVPQLGQCACSAAIGAGCRGAQRDRRRADHIGYIFQQFNLLPYLSVLDNVLLPCRFSRVRAERSASDGQRATSRSACWLLCDSRVTVATAGWRTLGWAAATRGGCARDDRRPELVIADEPTSALDEARRDAFMELLVRDATRPAARLLFVSHDARLASTSRA